MLWQLDLFPYLGDFCIWKANVLKKVILLRQTVTLLAPPPHFNSSASDVG